jgi:hypothetical protein
MTVTASHIKIVRDAVGDLLNEGVVTDNGDHFDVTYLQRTVSVEWQPSQFRYSIRRKGKGDEIHADNPRLAASQALTMLLW